jgi:hypothetical protein
MPENLDFSFRGKLADNHTLDFYEAGRFQYGASRLMVKLDQFRRTGTFSRRITYDNNTRILLDTHEDGSFLISTVVPFLQAGGDEFIKAGLGALLSHVTDRVLTKSDSESIKIALENDRKALEIFEGQIQGQQDQNLKMLQMLQGRLENGDKLVSETYSLYERLLAEKERARTLEEERSALRKISPEQDAKLISMATPLLKDMGVSLRNSASTLTIYNNDNENKTPFVFLDKKMASEIESSIAVEKPVLILVRIIQFNIENGWGKLRTKEHEGLLSFNVPSDRKGDVQTELIEAMNRAGNYLDTYVECLFVKSTAGLLQRMIILNVRDLDILEGM